MGHLHMRRQGLQSTRNKQTYTYLEDKCNTNLFFCTTVDPSIMKEVKSYSNLCWRFPIISSKGNLYIYVIYACGCNSILTTAIKNRKYKQKIRDFTEFTKDFKSRRINRGFHFVENEASTSLKMEITTMDINYQLFTPSNHRADNTERLIQTLKKKFIVGLCSVD